MRTNIDIAAHCDRMAFLLHDQSIALGDRVLQEVLQGVRNDREFGMMASHLGLKVAAAG